MSQVISLRLDPDLAVGLREVAEQRGVTVSDLLRQAAERIVGVYEDDQPAAEVRTRFEAGVERGYTAPSVTAGYAPPSSQVWGCQHMTLAGPFLCAPTGGCGCVMSLVETR